MPALCTHVPSDRFVNSRSHLFTETDRDVEIVSRKPAARWSEDPPLKIWRLPRDKERRNRPAVVVQRIHEPARHAVMRNVEFVGLDKTQKRDGSYVVEDSQNG